MAPHTPTPEQMLRFHAVIMKNNAGRLAPIVRDHSTLCFLREAVRQTGRSAITTPYGGFTEVNPRRQHYLETESALKAALERTGRQDQGPTVRMAQFLLANSLKHCRGIISIIEKYPSATGLASVG